MIALKYVTDDAGTRYGVDLSLAASIIADIRERPRGFVEGCQRDATVCIGPRNLCGCCVQFANASGYRCYPDDGNGHRRILRRGTYVTADALADWLEDMTMRRAA